MTVDERLRAAHARIPDPDAATVAQARAALTAAMAAPEGDTDAARRPADPRGVGRGDGADLPRAGRADGADPRGVGRGDGADLPRAGRADGADPRRAGRGDDGADPRLVGSGDEADSRARLGRRPRRRRLRLVLPVVALALAAVAAFALAPRDREVPAGNGRVTAIDPERVLAAGHVLYQRSTSVVSMKFIGADGRRVERPVDAAYAIARGVPEERWVAPDGSGRIRYGRTGAPFLPSPEDERAWRAAGSPDLEKLMPMLGDPAPKRRSFSPAALDTQWFANSNLEAVLPERDPLSVVPHDPRGLRAFLFAAAARVSQDPVPDPITAEVLALLTYPRTPADLRAALLEVVAALPGAERIAKLTDGAGRAVPALRYGNKGDTRVLAYDPVSSRLLAVGADAGGRVLWQQTFALEEGAVMHVGEHP